MTRVRITGVPQPDGTTADVEVDLPELDIDPVDPHCSRCGARPPEGAQVVVMVAGPDGPLCVTCAEAAGL